MALHLPGIPQLFKHSEAFSQGGGSERAGNNFVVSKDGSGDFSGVQEAINAADAGTTIFIRNGTYIEKLPLNLKSNVQLSGESLNAKIYFNMTSTASRIIDMDSKVRIILRDLTIEVSNPSDYTQDCKFISMNTSTDVLLQNVTATTVAGQLYNSTAGNGIIGGTTGMARIKFIDCNFSDLNYDADHFIYASASADNIQILNCQLRNCALGMAVTKSVVSDNRCADSFHTHGSSTENKIRHNNFGDEMNFIAGDNYNSIHGNKCGRILLAANANYNTVTGNINDLAVSDSGTGNSLSGNAVY